MKESDAAQLLQSTQRMRVAWTASIVSLIGYAWTLVIGIWAFLLKAWMDAQRDSNYILLAVASTSVVFGLWRWYTRYLDTAIANLYPTLVYCEQRMNVPKQFGTIAYLQSFVSKKFAKKLPDDPESLLNGVRTLVESKRIGHRGHAVIDLIALAIILGQFALSVFFARGFTLAVHVVAIPVVLSGALVLKGLLRSHRNPTREDLERAFPETSK